MRPHAGFLIAFLLIASGSNAIAQDQTINTEPAGCAGTNACPPAVIPFQGQGGYGQTFTALGSTLTSFTWYAGYQPLPAGALFEAMIMGFDPGTGRLTGDILFRENVIPGMNDVMAARTYMPGISVTPGQIFAAFLYLSSTPQTTYRNASMRWVSNSPYTDGRLFTIDAGNGQPTASSLQDGKLMLTGGTTDLSFSATFSNEIIITPEPSTLILSGSGLVLAAFLGFRRRKQRQTESGVA